jgi:hypothetical protein
VGRERKCVCWLLDLSSGSANSYLWDLGQEN